MSLYAHPTIPSTLPPKQVFKSDTGILRALSSDVLTLNLQYWITTRSILPTFTQGCQEAGCGVLYFTPFSTEVAWTRLYPNQPVSNKISTRHIEMAPPNFSYLASFMSTSPTPATPTSHNSLSNAHVEPSKALIAFMNQTLQKNATMMAHMQIRPSPLPAQQPLTSPQYKPQCPPFTKWDRTPPITPIFPAQVAT